MYQPVWRKSLLTFLHSSSIFFPLHYRATGPGILGYKLIETVLNPKDGSIYRVYTPDEGTLLPPDSSGLNRIPADGGEEVDGGGLIDPTPSVTTPSPGAKNNVIGCLAPIFWYFGIVPLLQFSNNKKKVARV